MDRLSFILKVLYISVNSLPVHQKAFEITAFKSRFKSNLHKKKGGTFHPQLSLRNCHPQRKLLVHETGWKVAKLTVKTVDVGINVVSVTTDQVSCATYWKRYILIKVLSLISRWLPYAWLLSTAGQLWSSVKYKLEPVACHLFSLHVTQQQCIPQRKKKKIIPSLTGKQVGQCLRSVQFILRLRYYQGLKCFD